MELLCVFLNILLEQDSNLWHTEEAHEVEMSLLHYSRKQMLLLNYMAISEPSEEFGYEVIERHVFE